MEILVKTVSVIGGIAGIIAFVWRVIDEFGSYLRIGVKAEYWDHKWVNALTSVENKGGRPKVIEWAVLLVGPENERPVETVKKLLSENKIELKIKHTNDIFYLQAYINSTIKSDCRQIIPIPFYYSENVRIADEALSYRVPIDICNFTPNTPISVRFFVFGKGRLHRSTQDSLIVKDLEPSRSSSA